MTDFIDKWSAKKAAKPRSGSKNTVEVFRGRIAEQKAYLEELEREPTQFKKWRSTWFQRLASGYGISVGRDSVNAGSGLSYVVVDSTSEISEFLDDLLHHAETDVAFQKALEENRLKRVARLNAGKAKSSRGSSEDASQDLLTNAVAQTEKSKRAVGRTARATTEATKKEATPPGKGRKTAARSAS